MNKEESARLEFLEGKTFETEDRLKELTRSFELLQQTHDRTRTRTEALENNLGFVRPRLSIYATYTNGNILSFEIKLTDKTNNVVYEEKTSGSLTLMLELGKVLEILKKQAKFHKVYDAILYTEGIVRNLHPTFVSEVCDLFKITTVH